MKKRTLAFLLALVMAVALLGACGSGNAENSGTDTPASSASPEGGASAEPAAADGDVYTVTWLLEGEVQRDHDRIVEKVNEITMRDLNMKLNVIVVPWGNAAQQRQLMLSSGEPLDLVTCNASSAITYMNAGQIINMDELIDKYATNIKSIWGEDRVKFCAAEDFVYGISNMDPLGSYPGIGFRKDIIDKYEIDVESIKSWRDLDPVFELIHEKEPQLTTCFVAPNQPPAQQFIVIDPMNDRLAVLDNSGLGTTELVPVTEAQAYLDCVYKTREWYEKGYINQDAATTTVGLETAFKSGDIFSALMVVHPVSPWYFGEVELTYATLSEEHINTSVGGNKMGISIAANSKDPEKAMQMLDYLYTATDVINLINWGEEGVDWEYIDDTHQYIDYPEGVTEDNVGYHARYHGSLPNQYAAAFWNGMNDPDTYENVKEFNKTGQVSEGFGFTFNPKDHETTLTALNNVKEKYITAIETGSVDPAEYIPMFHQELMENGLEEYMAAKQAAFDKWRASQGK